jgi:ABC-type transport system substrate-binding protein
MSDHDPDRSTGRQVSRRRFLQQVSVGAAGMAATGAIASRTFAQTPTPPSHPEWFPPPTKAPKRGGTLTRASAWDPPVLDPRLTQSVGLYQFAGLVGSRLVRYVFPDEVTGPSDLTLKGDLAESWWGPAPQTPGAFKHSPGG